MSASNVHGFHQPELSFSNDPTVVSSPSSSKVTVTRQAFLDVPPFRSSRPSLDSTYSELSELSFGTHELRSQPPLFRTLSRDGAATGSLRSRIVAAVHSFYVTNYGAMLVVLSQFFGAGMNVSTQLLETAGAHGEPMHPFQILFVRQSITAFLCTGYGIYSKSVPDFPFGPREVRWLLVARGLSGFFGVFGMYFSLLYLPLSEATVLTFLSPILTCYLCSFVMTGETFNRQQQLAGFLSLIGVVFIAEPASFFSSSATTATPHSDPSANPPSNSTATYDSPQQPTPDQHLAAIGVAMLGVLGSTGALTSIRAIGQRAHAFISINYFSVWCTIVSLVALIVFPDVKFRLPGNLTEWSLLASLGLCGFVMQFLLTAGLSYGGPTYSRPPDQSKDDQPPQKIRDVESNDPSALTSTLRRAGAQDENIRGLRHAASSSPNPRLSGSGTRATSMVYTQMLFALAADKLVFNKTPSTMSWVGSGLILAGAVWVASARGSAAEEKNRVVDGDASDVSGETIVIDTRRHGKNEAMVEETVGLMHDRDDDDDSGGDTRSRHPSGGNYDNNDRQQTGHTTIESLEMQQLRSTNSGY